MVCPYCHCYTPDQAFKCINCGAVIPKKNDSQDSERVSPLRKDKPGFLRPWMVILLGLMAFLGYLAYSRLNRVRAVNALDPGAEFAIEAHLKGGKTNIVDFYSDYCPPCRKISPLLKKLEKKRSDLVVLKVDINRKGVKGIDWMSPLARQYGLQSVPHFQIYDGEGKLVKQGQEAYMAVALMLAASGLRL